MLRLGIAGTNWISKQFVEAAHATGKYRCTWVYSRTEEKGAAFAANFQDVKWKTNYKAMVTETELDVVYIASPNSIHFEQAKTAIQAGKHVIVEKPAFSTTNEMEEILKLAKQYDVFYFEAARNIHENGFAQVKANLPDFNEIIGANFTYMKYSSRYDAVLAGNEPPIFSPHFSGGALMDLGVYLIYAAVVLFGVPEQAYYAGRLVRTGVDGIGTIIFRYAHFDVTMKTGKIGDSSLPSEIYCTDRTISLNGINTITGAHIFLRKTQEEQHLDFATEAENPMLEEADNFAQVMLHPEDEIQQKRYQEWKNYSKQVHILLEQLRSEAGIHFDADR